jgi:hypothetical protein
MQLRLSDPSWVPDLRQHFERSGFVTNRVGEDAVEVWEPGAASAELSKREIELHLGVWHAMHPDVRVEFL